jgi:hypothetical protein
MQSPNSESALTDRKDRSSPVVFSHTCSSRDVDLNSSSGNVPDLTTEFKTSSSDDVDVPDLINDCNTSCCDDEKLAGTGSGFLNESQSKQTGNSVKDEPTPEFSVENCQSTPTKLLLRKRIRSLQSQRWKLSKRIGTLTSALGLKKLSKKNRMNNKSIHKDKLINKFLLLVY